jgi:hypothetical protein
LSSAPDAASRVVMRAPELENVEIRQRTRALTEIAYPDMQEELEWAANNVVYMKGDNMTLRRGAALLYAIISLGIIAFQIALAAGAPWGTFAMGGAFPGQFPPALRIVALFQAAVLVGLALIVLARADLIWPTWSRVSGRLVWVVVAFSALSLVLNLITPSAGERAIWAPIACLLLISSSIVAFTNSSERPPR